MEQIATVNEVVNRISCYLKCTNKTVASLIGVTDSTLSHNLKHSMKEVESNKTGRRLTLLYISTLYLESNLIDHSDALKLLVEVNLVDHFGRPTSIKSAIASDVYDASSVLMFLDIAIENYKENRRKALRAYLESMKMEDMMPEEIKMRA